MNLVQRLSATEPRFRQPAQPVLRRATMQLAATPSSWPFLASALNAAPADPNADPLDTAARVKASAIAVERADHDEVIVTLAIDTGFHVSANPVSHDYLIPTTLTLVDVQPTHVRYPPASHLKPGIQADGLDVYEGQAQLIAFLPKGAIAARPKQHCVVRVQARDDKSCLPPAGLKLDVLVPRRD